MKSIRINEAASKLEELVKLLPVTGDVSLTRGDEPIARLTAPDGQTSLRDLQPSSVGAILRPLFGEDDDLLDEMLN
jgi:hypothetical protein